ncbi:MAG: HAAS signaling domain-containing protein [Leucobacter sp.]
MSTESYLAELEVHLEGVPESTRVSILEDVRAHLADSIDAGRSEDEALTGLGPVDGVAAQFRAELGIDRIAALQAAADEAEAVANAEERRARARRSFAVLGWTAFGLGVLTAVSASLLYGRPFFGIWDEQWPWEAIITSVVVAAVPVIFTLLPLLLPWRMRVPAAITGAIVVTVFEITRMFTLDDRGMFFPPLVGMMWLAVVVPWLVQHGFELSRRIFWRILGGVLVSLPVLMIIQLLVSESVSVAWTGAVILMGFLVLAVLYACGVRVAYWVTGALGAAAMLFVAYDPGLLFIGFWWAGGLLLAAGVFGIAATGPRVVRPVKAA